MRRDSDKTAAVSSQLHAVAVYIPLDEGAALRSARPGRCDVDLGIASGVPNLLQCPLSPPPLRCASLRAWHPSRITALSSVVVIVTRPAPRLFVVFCARRRRLGLPKPLFSSLFPLFLSPNTMCAVLIQRAHGAGAAMSIVAIAVARVACMPV